MTRKSFFFLIFLNVFLSVLPLSPGTYLNGFIALSSIFLVIHVNKKNAVKFQIDSILSETQHIRNFDPKKYYSVLIIFATLQLIISYQYSEPSLLSPEVQHPQIIYIITAEKPLHLLLTGTVIFTLFGKPHYFNPNFSLPLSFNLTNILVVLTAFNYFYTLVVEFILEYQFQLKYYQFAFPFGDMKELSLQFFEQSVEGLVAQLDQGLDQNTYKEEMIASLNFFIEKINAMINVLNLFYLVCLIRIFRQTFGIVSNSSPISAEFQYRWIKLPHILIWPFLLSWLSLLIDPSDFFPEKSSGDGIYLLLQFLKSSLSSLIFILGALYFIQGIGIFYFLVKSIIPKIKNSIWIFILITGILGLIIFNGNLFFIMLIIFIFSIGLMDQWINYRKI